jgi:hypothetical protein
VKLDSREVALTAAFSGLFVIINFLQIICVADPTFCGPIQLHVVDCLITLAALLGWAIVGGGDSGLFPDQRVLFPSGEGRCF